MKANTHGVISDEEYREKAAQRLSLYISYVEGKADLPRICGDCRECLIVAVWKYRKYMWMCRNCRWNREETPV